MLNLPVIRAEQCAGSPILAFKIRIFQHFPGALLIVLPHYQSWDRP